MKTLCLETELQTDIPSLAVTKLHNVFSFNLAVLSAAENKSLQESNFSEKKKQEQEHNHSYSSICWSAALNKSEIIHFNADEADLSKQTRVCSKDGG